MEISFRDVCDKLNAVEDREALARKVGVAKVEAIDAISLFPPNAGQETMRKLLVEIGFEIPADEEVSITLYPDVV